jgi:hypothetical protein
MTYAVHDFGITSSTGTILVLPEYGFDNGEMGGLSNNMTVRFSPDGCASSQYTDRRSSNII